MKRFIRNFLPFLLAGLFLSSALPADSKKPRRNEKQIILTTILKNMKIQRSLGPEAEVYYYPAMETVEVRCFETKETHVYIVNSYGQTVAYESFDADMTPFCMIDAPQSPGTYTIIIDSSELYAEGVLTVG